MKQYGIKPSAELITQMEMATLFLLRVADLYLSSEGRVGFVMPRSIFSADQHDQFRRGTDVVGITHLVDLDVSPLFNVPACIAEAEKSLKTQYPVEGKRILGNAD
jgi:hypothetical protein